LASIFIIKPMKASAMTKLAMRIIVIAATVVATMAFLSSPLLAATRNTSGDGSGIGGTGNSPTSGGGIGGTGTREQNSPKSMPDIPDRPEAVETPEIEPPELPDIDSDSSGMAPPPTDSLPEPPPGIPAER
jgi:hypothetical protein